MLVPLSWLNDYVDINVSADELEKKLFDCGFEVLSHVSRFRRLTFMYARSM